MSIHWLTIFLTHFILINSDDLSVNTGAKDRQWIVNSTNDINHPKRSDLLFEISDSGISIKNRKIPTRLDHQKTHYQQKNYRYNDNKKMFSEKDYKGLIAVLSKIAKIRTPEENPAATGQEYAHLQNRVSVNNTEELTFSNTKLFSKLPSNDTASNGERKRKNLHCRAIKKIYISVIKTYIPSYSCIFGNKTFILASKRFFQDLRSSLYIHIDDDMIHKLNNFAISTNNEYNVVPAILTLKPGHENYDIHN